MSRHYTFLYFHKGIPTPRPIILLELLLSASYMTWAHFLHWEWVAQRSTCTMLHHSWVTSTADHTWAHPAMFSLYPSRQFPLPSGPCFDLHFCLGIWLPGSDQTLTYNIHKLRSYGTEEVTPMGKTLGYVLRCSTDRIRFLFLPRNASGPLWWWLPSTCNAFLRSCLYNDWYAWLNVSALFRY